MTGAHGRGARTDASGRERILAAAEELSAARLLTAAASVTHDDGGLAPRPSPTSC